MATRWAAGALSDMAQPEYPRPQLVRADWLSLNGPWNYAITASDKARPQTYSGQILVPFPLESALSGVQTNLESSSTLWYQRDFEVPKSWVGRRVRLHFGAVDWQARVSVNGSELGIHRGGYDGFSFDITEFLRTQGPQSLEVAVRDPTEAGGQPRGKQSRRPEGIFYTATSGIWQTVWLEPIPRECIESLLLTPDIERSELRLRVLTGEDPANTEAEILVKAGGQLVSRLRGAAKEGFVVPIPQASLWTPDHPFLYDLTVRLMGQGGILDEVQSYFGMRKVEIGRDGTGKPRILLNGQFLFHVGTLDQGFWPDGLYTAPSDEALRYDVEVMKRFGFNMARKHVKVEPDRWYYWCDRLGLLVWQDMPSGHNLTRESRRQFEIELRAMIQGRWNHPSIVMWILFNEGWGQYDTERLTKWVKTLDPSRLVSNASGWTDQKVGDVIDQHSYPGPTALPPEPTRASVLGEFGGLGLGIEGHQWSPKAWGYRTTASQSQLTGQFVYLFGKAWELKNDPGLSGVVYTQITDVETECNGLMTYDRSLIKVDLNRARSAIQGKYRAPQVEGVVLLPTAEMGSNIWRYTTVAPSGGWSQADFDDRSWPHGGAGFGAAPTPGARVGTEWRSAEIWLRREFELNAPPSGKLVLRVHHDEDVEVFLNGSKIFEESGFTTDYEDYPLSSSLTSVLQPGRNVLAVLCHQSMGGQYIDVGMRILPDR